MIEKWKKEETGRMCYCLKERREKSVVGHLAWVNNNTSNVCLRTAYEKCTHIEI